MYKGYLLFRLIYKVLNLNLTQFIFKDPKIQFNKRGCLAFGGGFSSYYRNL